MTDRTADAAPIYVCANCDSRCRTTQPAPFCSPACQAQAQTVRAFRAAFATYGRHSLPEDVAQGLRIKMAHALAGGHDSPARHLSRAARDHIVERDGGRCVLCHSPATEIDHVGDVFGPPNLRLLCDGCHAGQALSHGRHDVVVRTDAEIDALFSVLTYRIDALAPTRVCDGAGWVPTAAVTVGRN